MEEKSEENTSAKSEYVLPSVNDFIKDENIAKAIENSNINDFVTLMKEETIVNIPLDGYAGIMVYGIVSN